MRICLIVPGFSSSENDWCIPALLDLVRRLSRDVELWVLALRYPFEASSYSVLGVPVRSLGAADGKGATRPLMFFRAVAAVLGQHRQRPFDVIHGVWADEAGLLATVCGRLLRRPTVVSVMGGELVWFADVGYGLQGNRIGRCVVERSLSWATEVTVGSALLEPKAAAVSGQQRFHRLPLGVEVERFTAEGPTAALSGDPSLVSVASLNAVKDHQTLIQAFSVVSRRLPHAHLHLVGDGPMRKGLEELAEEHGVFGAVTFHGSVAHDETPALYRAADLHVMSSLFESQCMTVLEAAACGTGTVGTAVGVLPELGAGARTVPTGDSEALAAELLAVLADPSTTSAMGQAAHRKVHDELALDQCAGGFLQLYRHLTGN